MRKILGLLICLVITLFVVSACGGSGDKVATVGTSEITVSEDTPTDTFYEKFRALIDQGPYLPWYTSCLEREAKKIISPAEAKELESASEAEKGKRLSAAFISASEACEGDGKRYIDPDASEAELEVVRSSEAVGVGAMLKAEGIPANLASCMEELVGAIPTKELLVLIEGEQSERERFFERLGARCE